MKKYLTMIMAGIYRSLTMTKRRLSICMGLCLLIVSLIGCSGTDENTKISSLAEIRKKEKLVVGVKYDTERFGFKENGELKGFEIELMRALSRKLFGTDDEEHLVFKEVNVKTRTLMLKNGDVDLVAATMTITDRRKKEIDFSQPYFLAEQAFLVPIDSPIKDDKDTNGRTIAALKGAIGGAYLKKRIPGVHLDLYENYGDAFMALRAGKAEAVISDNTILHSQTQRGPFKLINSTFAEPESYGIGVAKKNKELRQYINTFLTECWEQGIYQDIYKKYFHADPPANLYKQFQQNTHVLDPSEDFSGRTWSFDFIALHHKLIAKGFLNTLFLSSVSLILSLTLGVVIATLRMTTLRIFQAFGSMYTEFFRNTPLFVLVCAFYYARVIPIDSKFLIGVIALSLYTSAYIAEVIRAGILSVPTGQFEAAKAYGLNYIKTMRFIILPQTFRYILPSLGNQFINLIKNSSIVALIAGKDLLYAAECITAEESVMPVYVIIAALYLILTWPLSRGVSNLEKYWKRKQNRR